MGGVGLFNQPNWAINHMAMDFAMELGGELWVQFSGGGKEGFNHLFILSWVALD